MMCFKPSTSNQHHLSVVTSRRRKRKAPPERSETKNEEKFVNHFSTTMNISMLCTMNKTVIVKQKEQQQQHQQYQKQEEQKCSASTNICSNHRSRRSSSSAKVWTVFVLLAALLQFVAGRHYIAPGPCTWTHLGPMFSRDSIRTKSASSDLLVSEFDVALKCAVSALTPYTLNLSLIEPEHTVRLSISCYGGDTNSNDHSTLRPTAIGGAGSATHSHHHSHHHAHHQAMPFEHLRSMQSLELDNCKFDRFATDTFRGLVSLKNLTISKAIHSEHEPFIIEPDTFRHVANHLESLDLSFNRLDRLPADLFCPFVTLHSLNLTGNRLLDLKSFGLIDPSTGSLCLEELLHLDLSYNNLEFIPETSGVAALRHLHTLNLSSNHISGIAELAFTSLRDLQVLDLSGNRLRELPSRMFRNSVELRELHISGNGLTELPGGLFIGLSKLLVLDLSSNRITSEKIVADTFADLIRVVVLNLSSNNLRRLPGNVFLNLYSLQSLSLENNQLETIEDGAFATLYNLHTLRLDGNQLRQVSDSLLSGLFVLSQLHLANNKLETIRVDAFKNCTNLQTLDLSANKMESLPMALKSLSSLRRLNFARNKLSKLIESGPLAHTQQLESLNLSDNLLSNVTRPAFRSMASSLRELRLDGNRLRALEKGTFEDLRPVLRKLRLDRNDFTDVADALADIKQLERLEMLNASHNQISWFDYALIPAGLRVLDLSHNRVESLGNFYELEATILLEELDVSHNLIREILSSSIPNSIRSLNLRSNRIEKVDQFAFVAKHNVTFVDLRNNSLRRIDNDAFRLGVQRPTTAAYFLQRENTNINSPNFNSEYLPPPVFLIANNPYYCDCTMEWLQRVNQLVGGVTGSGTISTYPRIGDLEKVICELPFIRQASLTASSSSSSSSSSLSSSSSIGTATVTSLSTTVGDGSTQANELELKAVHVPLLEANSSNFLCRYRAHCFALCHCCEFDACDCEMMCPENCTCYYDQTWNTNIVDCSASNYRGSVPGRIPMDVTALYLDGNHLPSLNAHTFIGRKNLRMLHLNNSGIESIANRSFNGLIYLEELHLEHNKLTLLNGHEFEALHYLAALHLDHNQISFIGDSTFATLRSLQILHLEHNHITTFSSWFSQMAFTDNSVGQFAQQHRMLTIQMSHNRWACECVSLATLFDSIHRFGSQMLIQDARDLSCSGSNDESLNLLSGTMSALNDVLKRCNLTMAALPVFSSTSTTTTSTTTTRPNHRIPVEVPDLIVEDNKQTNPSIQTSSNVNTNSKEIFFKSDSTVLNSGDEDEVPIAYHPIDPFINNPNDGIYGESHSSKSSSSSLTNTIFGQNLFVLIVSFAIIAIFMSLLFIGVKRKQDIQLWFYRRYGVRLFESSGFCGCHTGGLGQRRGQRRRSANGFNDHYVRDSEKLFDAFVIYARPDEAFVVQQLAAELECGYPPYRLCLRHRDLPAPTTNATGMTDSTGKDHGYAFDAVTQAIECSRRTLVVISDNFLQSDWCRFELKAAHQETLSSCKTHRLIVVVVPTAPSVYSAQMPSLVPSQNVTIAKATEQLMQRLDADTRACIRGVSLLTWGERRFWEKLRFAMPPSVSGGATTISQPGSADGKIRAPSTLVVTNSNGYPSLAAASSLSSSSSLARSSVLYEQASQPIYYGGNQHHYHYAQFPTQQTSNNNNNNNNNVAQSLHKSSSLSIFSRAQQVSQSMNSPIRNPFSSKPLPPTPGSVLPLVGSHFNQQVELNPPTYASASEMAEYETTAEAMLSSANNQVMVNSPHHYPTGGAFDRSRTRTLGVPGSGQAVPFYHHHTANRRAPL